MHQDGKTGKRKGITGPRLLLWRVWGSRMTWIRLNIVVKKELNHLNAVVNLFFSKKWPMNSNHRVTESWMTNNSKQHVEAKPAKLNPIPIDYGIGFSSRWVPPERPPPRRPPVRPLRDLQGQPKMAGVYCNEYSRYWILWLPSSGTGQILVTRQ